MDDWRYKGLQDRSQYTVLDLFAGPGGLGEGFCGGNNPFSIGLSVEMECQAHRTLRLRSFFRQFTNPLSVPECYYDVVRGEISMDLLSEYYPIEWAAAEFETLNATLGDNGVGDKEVRRRVRMIKSELDGRPIVMIGGPPCQAYSLVGRARNRGNLSYVPESDHRHQLYLEYLKIIKGAWPAVFVMENVKGILSSKLNSEPIFPKILQDLRDPRKALGAQTKSRSNQRYRLQPVAVSGSGKTFFGEEIDPSSYVVRCEEFGVPQKRHRVFILGIREDIDGEFDPLVPQVERKVTVRDMLASMPPVRSGLSPREEEGEWAKKIQLFLTPRIANQIEGKGGAKLSSDIKKMIDKLQRTKLGRGADFLSGVNPGDIRDSKLSKWIQDPRLKGICNHSTRSHMQSDLLRYLYVSSYASEHCFSPTLAEFPKNLMPAHQNAAESARKRSMFVDRFKVQLWDQPSTTVTSHISKDGHYFIHPDPAQCRSLTVREAARLQTFPDNYFFCGPRTSQYAQVGNAVPPFMASQIASQIEKFLKEAKL